MPLNERKKQILYAVVKEHVNNAEPVGSRTLARRYNLGFSSATIRNEMADLEEMGYLKQPHTSAGRIPSEKGYRYYVDFLMEVPALTEEEEIRLNKALKLEKMREIEQIIQNVSKGLSEITNYTSLVIAPQLTKSAFKEMRIIPIDEQRGIVVLITDTGFIKNKIINLPRMLNPQELNQVVNYLNKRLRGLAIDQVTNSLLRELKRDLFHRIEILEQAFLLLEESLSEDDNRIFLGGTTKILNQPEFKNVEKIKRLLSLFEQDSLLMSLLSSALEKKDVWVKIGKENKLKEAQECSLVTASYKVGGKTIGTIGVLGPTRMQYAKVIAIVKYFAEQLNQLF
ncbi:MAG: heat-inducible transcriptional repressor HrcA [Dethiobacteria bacterium]|nr:heat-inducible transcription repressor HrcA [Bacillota bacterium]